MDSPEDEESQESQESPESPEASREQELEAQLEDALRQRGELEMQLQRLATDYRNLERRTAERTADAQKEAGASAAAAILPILDNLSLAAESADASESALAAGVKMVISQLHEVLRQLGAEEIDAEGAPFDPHLHSAVAVTSDAEGVSGTVHKVHRRGYAINGKVLRPAMVTVIESRDGLSGL